jgi:hypothetical protein
MEIAGFEENTSDGRPPTPSTAAPGSPAPASPPLGRRVYQKGLQTFVWRADDENDDRLQYDALYRREGETEWRPLRRGLWDPIYVWDTTSVPDGTYVVKIAASDAPANSPATALVGELESTSFDVDNSPPRIEIQPAKPGAPKSGGRAIAFVVRDDHSAVQRVEYSLDGATQGRSLVHDAIFGRNHLQLRHRACRLRRGAHAFASGSHSRRDRTHRRRTEADPRA